MAQVILIETNKTMNDLLSINLTTYLGVDLIQRKNAQETLNLLAILPDVDLIITNSKIENEDSANIINNYLLENNLPINLISMGENPAKNNENHVNVENNKAWEKVVQITAKLLGINEEVLTKKAVPDYIPVPVRYFLNLDATNCDIFIRIKKSPTEYQFVKRIHKGDSFNKEAINRYLEQGLQSFFVPKEHHKNFAIFLSNRLVEKIESPKIEFTEKILLMGESYDIAVKETIKLGFNSENVQLTDTIIQNMIKNFEKYPKMSELLHKVINSQTGSLYQRSHMTSVVACEVLKNLKITDHAANEKMAFASFFHDIILTEREELAKINSMEELESINLTNADKELVLTHAREAALLIQNHPEAPLGADEIIRHHHGDLDGSTFSNNIDQLPDLSKVFIVAHHFVLELQKFKENGGDPKPVTEELSRRYPGPDIALIIKALEKTLKKKK